MTMNVLELTVNHMNNNLLRMGFLVETQLKRSVKALVNKDIDLADFVLKEDIHINDLMRIIEDEAIRLIATQAPVASDLRNIFTIIKIVTDMERMGDHAKDIANISIVNHEINTDLINDELIELTDLVIDFIGKSIDAFVAKDQETALGLTYLDNKIEEVTTLATKKLYERANQTPDLLKLAGQLQFVIKYLERVGDHATNICEWTAYIVTGQFVELKQKPY
ncbi:MAG: phosphate signaling complex protein PhoU [Clostridiaceae bacterium]